ncbi:MAG TPA: 2Fe-2S iron-sulfur cluster-binding protein, partial [Roseateles sp.]
MDEAFGSLSRRDVLIASAGTATISVAGAADDAPPAIGSPPGTMARLTLEVNGKPQTVDVDNRTTLLDLLREQLKLTGTKKGCDHGQCGACTVLVDGQRINACLTLAMMHDGREITTVEGLSQDGQPHP